MVIVNVLPEFNVICASLVDLGLGSVVEELQVDIATGVTRCIELESSAVALGDELFIDHFVLNMLIASSIKMTERLGKPWHDGGLSGISQLMSELPEPIEICFNRELLINTMGCSELLSGNPLQDKGFSLVRGDRDDSVLFGNSHWITSNPPVVLS